MTFPFAFRPATAVSDDAFDGLVTSKEHGGNMDYAPEKLNIELDAVPNKRKKKKKRIRRSSRSSVDNKGLLLSSRMECASLLMYKTIGLASSRNGHYVSNGRNEHLYF